MREGAAVSTAGVTKGSRRIDVDTAGGGEGRRKQVYGQEEVDGLEGMLVVVNIPRQREMLRARKRVCGYDVVAIPQNEQVSKRWRSTKIYGLMLTWNPIEECSSWALLRRHSHP